MSAYGIKVNDEDKSLQTKAGGKFGLNTGNITKLEYNPNGGKDDTPTDCVDICILLDDKEYKSRVYDVTKVYKGGEEITSENPAYEKAFEAELSQHLAVIMHAVKSLGVTSAQIDAILKAKQPNNFKEWVEAVLSLLPADYQKRSVDVFLEYQWTIGEGNTRTFLQIPRNMKGGKFLCASPAHQGEWKEVLDGKLTYIDDLGAEHPFTKDKTFMESKKAIMQTTGDNNSNNGNITPNQMGAAVNGSQKAAW